MGKYRKKPVVIEAVHYRRGEIPDDDFIIEGIKTGKLRHCDDDTFLIDTLEGSMIARPGDWIIRGVKGEFYPCKPDIFEATYEPEEAPDAK